MLKKGVSLGCLKAHLNLGLMYYNEKYKIQNFEKAFYFIEEASKEEYDKAQYYMGIFHEKGFHVEKDLDKAIYWYEKSAKNAYHKAYKKLEEYNVELKMSI